jgi:hypothetical protein
MPVTATVVTVVAAHTITCQFGISGAVAHTGTCQFAILVAAVHTATRVTVVLTTVLTVTPVTTAHITGLMDMHLSAAMATVVTVAAAHTVTCQCGITVAAALTGTLVIIGPGTELMDPHHLSRGIAFIDRFSLSQVSCPATARLVLRRTGADVKSAPHALWLDS